MPEVEKLEVESREVRSSHLTSGSLLFIGLLSPPSSFEFYLQLISSPGRSQKSLCTTPGVGVSVGGGVHIYVKVFLMAYIFQTI